MNQIKRISPVFMILGLIYLAIEFQVRAFQWQTLNPWVPFTMFLIGGSAAFVVGLYNEIKWIRDNVNMFWQSILSAITILAFEFVGGCIVNLWLGLDIWDYTHMAFNLLGQICLQYGIYWLLISPFAIWLDDQLRWYFCFAGGKYSLWLAYKYAFIPWASAYAPIRYHAVREEYRLNKCMEKRAEKAQRRRKHVSKLI